MYQTKFNSKTTSKDKMFRYNKNLQDIIKK